MIKSNKVFEIFRNLTLGTVVAGGFFAFFAYRIHQGYLVECSHDLNKYCDNFAVPLLIAFVLFILSFIFGFVASKLRSRSRDIRET